MADLIQKTNDLLPDSGKGPLTRFLEIIGYFGMLMWKRDKFGSCVIAYFTLTIPFGVWDAGYIIFFLAWTVGVIYCAVADEKIEQLEQRIRDLTSGTK
jgi:hypothetical protein